MEPTPEQVEAVARAIDNEMPGYGYGERAARAAIAAIRQAEPLTSTPEPSTTETDGEAAISQDPPPSFEWEYRAVEQMEDTVNGGWYDPNGWGWTSEHDAHADALLIEGACVKERVRVWLERRLVGPAERVQE